MGMPASRTVATDLELTIGTNVRRLREQRGLSQADLADRLSVIGDDGSSQAVVAALEAGRRRPRLIDLAQVCAALDCPLGALLEDVEETWLTDALEGHWTPPADYEEKVRRASDSREDYELAKRLFRSIEKHQGGRLPPPEPVLQQWVSNRYGASLREMRERDAQRIGGDTRMARQHASKALIGALTRDYIQERAQ